MLISGKGSSLTFHFPDKAFIPRDCWRSTGSPVLGSESPWKLPPSQRFYPILRIAPVMIATALSYVSRDDPYKIKADGVKQILKNKVLFTDTEAKFTESGRKSVVQGGPPAVSPMRFWALCFPCV